MVKYLLAVLILIFGALASMYFWIGVPRVYREVAPEISAPHFYRNPERKIFEIKIAAFYFTPKNKTTSKIENWREVLEKNLQKLQEFHALQLQGRSRLGYEIYPEPVIGREDNRFYDTDVTQHGNPEALRKVAEELELRVLNPQGDLYRADFVKGITGAYRVLAIMYEGVGASGSDNVAFVSRVFLADSRYQAVSSSILAHEFYHTLGIPDAYDLETAIPTSQDIMGLGRTRPIEKTYIRREVLKELGL